MSVNVYLLVPNTSISPRYKCPVDVMLILRYFPRASPQHYKLCSAVMKISSTEHCPVSVGEEVFCTVDGKT